MWLNPRSLTVDAQCACLPMPLTQGAAPPPPADFGDGYVLPVHGTEMPLQRASASHPLDARLRFYEGPHIYTVDDVPTSASVTALAHAHERPFVPSEAIRLMKNSRTQAWPRLEYVVDARPGEDTWDPSRGALLVQSDKTVAALHPHTLRQPAALREALDAVRLKASAVHGTEEASVHTFARVLDDAEIEARWKAKGQEASHRGTEAHWMAECFFNGLPYRHWAPEMGILHAFVEEVMVPRGWVALHTEKEIVCLDADLAGSIDLLVRDPSTGLVHIVDHKRSDKLRAQLRGFGKMTPPLAHLDDCKGAAYALQTSIYQYILERDYGMRIGQRILLSLHPDHAFCTVVPHLASEAAYLVETRVEWVAARRAAAQGRVCSLTGAPLVDAVQCGDEGEEGWAIEKAAQLRGLHYEVDAAERARAAALVDERLAASEVRLGPVTSWRRQMPEGGLPP